METKKKSFGIYLKLIYALFFITAYIFSVMYLFPYHKVKDWLQVKLSAASSFDVTIDDMGFSPFDGVKLTGIKVDNGTKGAGANLININELSVMPKFASLFSGTIKLEVESKLYGGEVEGSVDIARKPKLALQDVNVRLDNIDMSKIAVIPNRYRVNVNGVVKGDISLRNIDKGMTRSSGDIKIGIGNGTVTGIVLDDISSGLLRFDNMKIPDIRFRDIKINMQKNKKLLKINKVEVTGDDISGKLDGNINLNDNLMMSSGNLILKFNLSKDYLLKEKTLSLFDKNFGSFKDADGYYKIKLEGLITKPRVRSL